MTDDYAIEGEDGGYVPCEQEADQLVVEEEGAISGLASGFVALDAEAAVEAPEERAAIVGSGVGFVPKPCEEPLCGGFPYGPELQAVWQNLTPGTTSPLNTTAGTVTFEQDGTAPPGTGNVPPGSGTLAEPPGFISPGNYAYRWTDPTSSTFLITVQPILRFSVEPPPVGDPGELIYQFKKNGVVLAQVAATVLPVGIGPAYWLAVADPIWVPETLCIETGDELSCWITGDLSNLVSVNQGRIRLETYDPPP